MCMNLQEFKKQIGDKNGNYPEKICDNYCKYPEIYSNEEEEDKLYEHCDKCPLNKLM